MNVLPRQLPSPDLYQQAIQSPFSAFLDTELRACSVATSPLGLPTVLSGGFALTYQLQNGSRRWAVRCFHRRSIDFEQLERRYRAIEPVTASHTGGIFSDVQYLTHGIFADGGWFPITKMPWLQATPINRYIETNLDTQTAASLETKFRRLVDQLRTSGIAHGDLQHGNILVDGTGSLRLIDYDGMYVPALACMPASEAGHPNYQHPLRSDQFDAHLDRFSSILITVALRAIAANPTRWHTYSNGDNLLFRQSDLADPDNSPLFCDLLAGSTTGELAERLRRICRTSYDSVPTLDDFLAGHFQARTSAAFSDPTHHTAHFPVIDACDRDALLLQEGNMVTVVGRISEVGQDQTDIGKPYTVIYFGSWRTRDLRLVLWSDALGLFKQRGIDPSSFGDAWVSVTGLMNVYRPRRRGLVPRPQLVISMPSEIQRITPTEATALLSPRPASSGRPARPRSDEDTLNDLYANHPVAPKSASPAPPHTATPAQPTAGASISRPTATPSPHMRKAVPAKVAISQPQEVVPSNRPAWPGQSKTPPVQQPHYGYTLLGFVVLAVIFGSGVFIFGWGFAVVFFAGLVILGLVAKVNLR